MLTDTQYQLLPTDPSLTDKNFYYSVLKGFGLSSDSPDWAGLCDLLKKLSTEGAYLGADTSCNSVQIFFEEIITALGEDGYYVFQQILAECYHDYATRADLGFTNLCHWRHAEDECEDFLTLNQGDFIGRMDESPIAASALFAMLACTIEAF